MERLKSSGQCLCIFQCRTVAVCNNIMSVTLIYSSHHISLKMAYKAETCCWWCIINKFVSRLVFYSSINSTFKHNVVGLLKKMKHFTDSHLAIYAWLSTLSGTPWMLASIGTLATAGWTALSTGYVATEIIISHHTPYIWLKQTNKQTWIMHRYCNPIWYRQVATIQFWECLSTSCNSHTSYK